MSGVLTRAGIRRIARQSRPSRNNGRLGKMPPAGTARRTGAKEGVRNVYEISRRGSAADFLRIGSLKAGRRD
ncbi:hypothetical protein [Treponema endosymbiont of Eucomonympha sp.]|uniref:hypothetical protein n=1 Tax=Treponema endosymbiont of Eucomonympha sp. TaxID=1580831 RepID=UPI001396B7AF|nr:hypothetical protein [Treponema endosymbiont of Eucomonympha sp.]